LLQGRIFIQEVFAMVISAAIEKMIGFYEGNPHDVNHFLKVYAFARTIGKQEGLDAEAQRTLELAAVVHDIACPLCREKYGQADGRHQEAEGPALAQAFLAELPVSPEMAERVCSLVGRHHTYTNVDGLDHQILLEADFLVNADEARISESGIRAMLTRVFKTETGTRLLRALYGLD
jgi:HD superfamily phosphodiesterase